MHLLCGKNGNKKRKPLSKRDFRQWFFAICEKKVTVGDMFEKNSVCNVTVILSQKRFFVTGKNYFISGGKNDVTD